MGNSKDQKFKNLSLKSYIDGPLLQKNNVDASTSMFMVVNVFFFFFSTDNKFVYVRGSHKPHSNQ